MRNLRDAGMEVIYTGLFQTPPATVYSALQEDVDVLGVSVLSAAHMSIMPEVIRLRNEAGIEDMPVIVGGIIPEQDHQDLKKEGVAAVFNPGTPMSRIIEQITELAESRHQQRASREYTPDISTPAGLARAITELAGNGEDITKSLPDNGNRGLCLGVTGSPGVGKSTFIGRLARELRRRDRKVAVIAVDPSSPLTGGSLLGDRLRMMPTEPDDGMFVRSQSSSGEAGGLGPKTAEIAKLLTAAGFEMILIETVGAGQNDVAIRNVADEVLLLLMPGAGDSVQFTKAGVVEIATGFVVNKADLPGAEITIKDLRDTLEDDRPIWSVSSLRGEGLDPLCEWIEQKRSN